MSRVVKRFASGGGSVGGEGGYQAGNQFGKDAFEAKYKEMEKTLPFSQQAKALFDFGLLFACFGFAFASSLRANHRQVLHDEELEALNYELAETQDQITLYKSNWSKIDSFLSSKTVTLSKGGEPLVPLSLVQSLIQQELFKPATTAMAPSSPETLTILDSTSANTLSSSDLSNYSSSPAQLPSESAASSRTNQEKSTSSSNSSTGSLLPRSPPTRVILYQC